MKDSCRRSVVYRQRQPGPRLVTGVDRMCRTLWALGRAASLRCRRPLPSETALPEANSFLCGCQPFCDIALARNRWRARPVTAVTFVIPGEAIRDSNTQFDPGKSGQYPRTVARKRRYGCDPHPGGDRAGKQDARAYQRWPCSHLQQACGGGAGATRNKEKLPWPRASGPSSPTTGVAHGCMVSVCGCVPARVAPSCPAGVARVVSRCLRDSPQDLRRCFRRITG
jgi:hypothetical protein